jgi:hypothetical protein
VVVEAGHPFGDSVSEAFSAESVAVLMCCVAFGLCAAASWSNDTPRDACDRSAGRPWGTGALLCSPSRGHAAARAHPRCRRPVRQIVTT